VTEQLLALLAGKGGIVLSTLFLFLVLERLFPVARWVGGISRLAKNFAVAGCNFLIGPLIVIPVTAFAVAHAPDWRPELWSGWPGLLLDLLVLDLWIYWWHRANHEVPFLWRFHAVHHLDETLDATTALRFHFGEVALSAVVRAVVIFLLAMPLSSVLVFEILIAVATIFHHSNLKLPPRFERLLSFLMVTPSIHWIHHHAVRADTDSSYATVLSLWDRLFGSRSRTVRTPGLQIGVEGVRDLTVLRLLARPFLSK
jgi:sterol desaturase/sphingolipid hydroxylase (fatty acid hydroxylase superfamily)